MVAAGFVFIWSELDQMETVVIKIVKSDGVSEDYPISGNYDVLAKVYVDRYEDFATVLLQWTHHIAGIRETPMLMTFNAFTYDQPSNGSKIGGLAYAVDAVVPRLAMYVGRGGAADGLCLYAGTAEHG